METKVTQRKPRATARGASWNHLRRTPTRRSCYQQPPTVGSRQRQVRNLRGRERGRPGVYAVYEKEGVEGYQVAVIRWGSEGKAIEGADTFESYAATTYVVLGRFSSIAYDNGLGEEPYELLGQSSALTAEYAENNDIIS